MADMERTGKSRKRKRPNPAQSSDRKESAATTHTNAQFSESTLQNGVDAQPMFFGQMPQPGTRHTFPSPAMNFEEYLLQNPFTFEDLDFTLLTLSDSPEMPPLPEYITAPSDTLSHVTASKTSCDLSHNLGQPAQVSHIPSNRPGTSYSTSTSSHSQVGATTTPTVQGIVKGSLQTQGIDSPASAASTADKADADLRAFQAKMQRYFTKLLFELRSRRDEQFFDVNETHQRKQRQVLFPLVQSFSTSLKSLMAYYRDTLARRKPDDDDQESNRTFMLCFMASALVLEIYKAILRGYTRPAGRQQLPRPHKLQQPTPQHSPGSGPSSPDTVWANQINATRQTTNSIMHLTMMDCHLASLQHVFQRLNSSGSFRRLLAGNSNGIAEMQELRKNNAQMLDELKSQL